MWDSIFQTQHPENIVSIKHKSRNRRHHLKPGSQRCWFLCPKCSKTHLRASLIPKKISWGDTPGPHYKGRGEGGWGAKRGGKRREGRRERGRREGRGNCAVVNFPLKTLSDIDRCVRWIMFSGRPSVRPCMLFVITIPYKPLNGRNFQTLVDDVV